MTGLNGSTSHQPLVPFGVTSFVVQERTTRLVAGPETGFEGFEVDVRSNLSGAERQRLVEGLDEIDEAISEVSRRYGEEGRRLQEEFDTAKEAKNLDRQREIDRESSAQLRDLQRETEALAERRLPLIAPYVKAWNIFTTNDDGIPVEVPPPAIGGVESFEAITPAMVSWLRDKILIAYRSGKGLSSPSILPRMPDSLGLPVGGPNIAGAKEEMQRTRPSRKKSSTPSASISTG